MEINRDALLRVVKATRTALKMKETFEGLMIDKNTWTIADEIYGQLFDALFILGGEKLAVGDGVENSTTDRLIKGDMSDGGVTDWLLMMDRIRKHIEPELVEDKIEQPKPQTITNEKFQDLYRRYGGYTSPEGEWT